MKYLVLDACTRANSRTKKMYETYLENIDGDVKIINLYDLDLKPLNEELLNKRDSLIAKGLFNDEMFNLANEFKSYDFIIVAAPYWDMSFPAILKLYFENISVSGVTFIYENGMPKGLCKANKLLYLASCGGYVNNNLGYEYVKELVKMYGIYNTKYYQIDKLDIDPSKEEKILNEGLKELKSLQNDKNWF